MPSRREPARREWAPGAARDSRDESLAETPVMLVSAGARASDVERGLAAGADDYMTKPFTSVEVMGRVSALIQGHR